MTLSRIVSGGQTGVDRGALDACLKSGFPCGGWCPHDRLAEDGVIAPHYPLKPLPDGDYRARTTRNVLDSDGTVIFHFGLLEGGTAHTRNDCTVLDKPLLLIDGDETYVDLAAQQLRRFIGHWHISVLNVAGPRRSESSQGYDYAFGVIHRLLRGVGTSPSGSEN